MKTRLLFAQVMIWLALFLLLLIAMPVEAQDRATYVHVGAIGAFHQKLNYAPGFGFSVGGHFILPEEFALLVDFERISERKHGYSGGRTLAGSVGLRRYFGRYFTQIEGRYVDFKNDSYSKGGWRVKPGIGIALLDEGTWMPKFEGRMSAIFGVGDNTKGIEFATLSAWQFPNSVFGLIAQGKLDVTRGRRVSGVVEFGGTLSFSALAGR